MSATRATALSPAENCREALASLDRALAAPPAEVVPNTDAAERALVRVRDGLIERRRAEGPADERERWRAALEKVNVGLSLVVGVEYPSAGLKRKSLEQARELLGGLLADGLP